MDRITFDALRKNSLLPISIAVGALTLAGIIWGLASGDMPAVLASAFTGGLLEAFLIPGAVCMHRTAVYYGRKMKELEESLKQVKEMRNAP